MQQAESFLTNSDKDIRISAYAAISRMDNPGAFDIINENFQTEKNMSIKSSILKSMGDIPPSEKIMEFYRKEAEAETNNNLLIPIADSLAKNSRNYPDNKQALKTIIEKKPSGQVLRAIYRYVSPDYLKN